LRPLRFLILRGSFSVVFVPRTFIYPPPSPSSPVASPADNLCTRPMQPPLSPLICPSFRREGPRPRSPTLFVPSRTFLARDLNYSFLLSHPFLFRVPLGFAGFSVLGFFSFVDEGRPGLEYPVVGLRSPISLRRISAPLVDDVLLDSVVFFVPLL